MRKIINVAALLLFAWLVIDALGVPTSLLYFLLVGELPGTNVSLPPSVMLAIMTLGLGLVVFELFARRIELFQRLRQQMLGIISRREQLPRRRYTRI